MRIIYSVLAALAIVTFVAACGSAQKEKGGLTQKKAELEKLKAQSDKLDKQIAELEQEIAKLDTAAATNQKAKLVTLSTLEPANFSHYINLQGRVESDNIAYVTPRGQGGMVEAIHVKQGDYVRKGQLLMRLDSDLAERRIEQLQIQLDHAKDLYQRRQNLWNQKIGTEVELLNAKTNVENLEKQISIAKEELGFSNVYAQMDGVAEEVNIKVGESFTPLSAATNGIRIVNTSNLKVTAEVPENYLGRIKEGTEMLVVIPEQGNDSLRVKIATVGRVIDPSRRSFYVEARIPASRALRPNQITMVYIKDYTARNTITIPVNTLQNDDKGKFVLVAVKQGDKLVAEKRMVQVGELTGNQLEVKSGLNPGDQLIVDGFQNLYDGQLVTTNAG